MARFNTPTVGTRTVNLAGGEAFSETPDLELVSVLLTSFVQDQFYRSANDTMLRIAELIKQNDKKFAAKAAIFARTEFGMRSITHVVAAELAAQVKGEQWTSKFINRVVARPDDVTEILSYYINKYGKRPIPNSLKKGLATALTHFDAYQLTKYRSAGKELSLVDAVNLVHPKSTPALAMLVAGTLRSTETWESKLSASGGDAAKKAEAWRELLSEKKIGYFALLRNLRNILEQANDLVPLACEILTDPSRVEKSLVLPFRFFTAIKEIEELGNTNGVRQVLMALATALDLSTKNVPTFSGRTLVALDVSGSMTSTPFGSKAKWVPADIGAVFAAVLVKANPTADLLVFDNPAHFVAVNPLDSTTTIARRIPFHGGGTNFHSIFEGNNNPYTRIIILSDMQAWIGYHSPQTSFAEYKRRTSCDPFIYSFDLAGYGTLQFPERNVFALAGFSDKVLDVMALLETDRKNLIHKIQAIEL